MLEIVFIILLWQKMGTRMRRKGYRKPIWFQLFVPIGWVAGQLAGAVAYGLVGAAAGQQTEGFDPMTYLAALVGAGLGVGVVFVGANSWPHRFPRPRSVRNPEALNAPESMRDRLLPARVH